MSQPFDFKRLTQSLGVNYPAREPSIFDQNPATLEIGLHRYFCHPDPICYLKSRNPLTGKGYDHFMVLSA
jgi:hypothetical protein